MRERGDLMGVTGETERDELKGKKKSGEKNKKILKGFDFLLQ